MMKIAAFAALAAVAAADHCYTAVLTGGVGVATSGLAVLRTSDFRAGFLYSGGDLGTDAEPVSGAHVHIGQLTVGGPAAVAFCTDLATCESAGMNAPSNNTDDVIEVTGSALTGYTLEGVADGMENATGGTVGNDADAYIALHGNGGEPGAVVIQGQLSLIDDANCDSAAALAAPVAVLAAGVAAFF